MCTDTITSITSLTDLICKFVDIIQVATPIVVALALLYFFYGLAKFILYSDDEAKRKENRNIMVWGIIALFVMVSIWGIINVLLNTFIDTQGGEEFCIDNDFDGVCD